MTKTAALLTFPARPAMLTYTIRSRTTGETRTVIGEAALSQALTVTAPKPVAAPVRFLWNGIKDSDGKLQRAHYSFSREFTAGPRTIPTHATIYARDYDGFSAEVHAEFTVENTTDTQADHFDHDHMRVSPSHPRFLDVMGAYIADLEKSIRRCEKRGAVGEASAKGYRQSLAEAQSFIATIN